MVTVGTLYNTFMIESFRTCGMVSQFGEDVMEARQDKGFVVVVDLEQIGGEGVIAGRLPVVRGFLRPLKLLDDWCRSQPSGGWRRWSLLHLVHDVWFQGRGLGIEEGLEEFRPVA